MKGMFSSFFVSGAWFLLSGCVSLRPQETPIREAIFKNSLQQVWIATEKTLATYPISESNVDSGILRTDYLRGASCWLSPGNTEHYSAGVRCHLVFQFVTLPGNSTRVRVTKTMEMVRDFVSEPEVIPSDGLEEISLLYRIDRELTMTRELNRANRESK
jgi:hypothetical protein